jgi:predicted sugar kinase
MAFKMNPKSPALKSAGRYAAPKGIQQAVTSPAKQKVNREDGVQVKEVPRVVEEEVKKAGKFVGKEAKKVGKWFKKLGNISLTKTKKEKLKKAEEKVAKLKNKTKQ